ncbi:hypothetical protein [Labilibaculum euxinus]
MKLIDRITYITFVINIIALLFYFIGLPIILIKVPGSFDLITINRGQNPYNLAISIVAMILFFHWAYCLWFLYKYDRYSKSIFPLFFFNVLYAPIYYYRVKIKKRPLRNQINRPIEKVETEDISITDDEFLTMTRNNIFGVIDLWASKEKQIDYQNNVPIAQVSAELFCQWEDFYFPDSDDFKQSFCKKELEILSDFDKALNDTVEKTPQDLPLIEEFVETKEWIEMNKIANEIKKQLNTVGNNAL